MRPRLLDLFCGAGGAAMGYHRAGFDVVGVDIAPQPHYPFEFFQANALDVIENPFSLRLPERFAAIHASPPCQSWTAYRRRGGGVGDGYPELILETQRLLYNCGVAWVIENVRGSVLDAHVQLCGSMFGLDVRRHRLFESSFPIMSPPCVHSRQRGCFPHATNRTNPRKTVEVGVWRIPLEVQKQAMGVDWDCTLEELSEMVPPAYTQFIGEQLLSALERAA